MHSSWGRKESDTTEQLNRTDIYIYIPTMYIYYGIAGFHGSFLKDKIKIKLHL